MEESRKDHYIDTNDCNEINDSDEEYDNSEVSESPKKTERLQKCYNAIQKYIDSNCLYINIRQHDFLKLIK